MIPTRYNVALVSIVFVIGLAELCAPVTAAPQRTPCASSSWSPLGPWQPAEIGTEKTYRYRVLGGDTPPCAMEVETLTRDTATGAITTVLSPLPAVAQDPTTQPLLTAASVTKIGAFTLPTASAAGEQNTFAYGGEAMCFDPYRNSLWITGHDWHDRLAEVTIPALGQRAAYKTPWIDMAWRLQLGGGVNMGGCLPLPNGDLLLSAFVYYDSNESQTHSHVRRTAAGQIGALTQIGSGLVPGSSKRVAAGFVSGWMLPIPADWQALFGGPALTGNGALSIIGRTSHGPAVAVFTPSAVTLSGGQVPGQLLLGYPIDHPTLGTCETGVAFNCYASNRRAGVVWPVGTRSLLYFTVLCAVPPTYAGGWGCAQPVARVQAFDALDLLAVKHGTKQPWEPLPYATWDITGDFAWPSGLEQEYRRLKSIAYDPMSQRIFVLQDHGDGAQPLIVVYQVNAAGAPPPPPPPPPPPTGQEPANCTQAQAMTVLGSSWTIGAQDETLRNGTHFGGGRAKFYQWIDGVLWILTQSSLGHWAKLTSPTSDTEWTVVGTTAPPCPGIAPPPADTIAPSVLAHADPLQATVGGLVSLSADALDNVGVVGVEFQVNGQRVTVDAIAPYVSSFTPSAPGTYTVTATARDAAGLSASDSVTVTATDPLPPPPPPPIDPCVADPVRLSVGAWPVHVSGRQTQMRYTVTTSAVSWRLTDVRPERIEVTDSRGCTAAVAR